MALAAFAIDIGYLAKAKSQLQNAVDAAALAGALELDPLADQDTVLRNVTRAAVQQAAMNKAADHERVEINSSDVELGRRHWDAAHRSYRALWGDAARPYNLVRVTARREEITRRTRSGWTIEDRRIPLFFAKVIGHNSASLKVTAAATIDPRDNGKLKLIEVAEKVIPFHERKLLRIQERQP